MPALHDVNPGYDFCVELFGALDARRSEIRPRDPAITFIAHGQNMMERSSADETLENSLQLTIAQLRLALQPDGDSRARAIQMLELCITTGRMETCGATLLKHLSDLSSAPQLDAKLLFSEFFVPFLRELRTLLEQFDLLEPALHAEHQPGDSADPSVATTRTFYRDLIKSYMLRCLGIKPLNMGSVKESLGCGCTTCEKLDHFLNAPDQMELHVFGDGLSLNHFQLRVQRNEPQSHVTTALVSDSGRQKLVIAKQQDHVSLAVQEDWKRRKAEAVKFLALLGNWRSIRRIMNGDHDQYLGVLHEPDISKPVELDLSVHNDWV